MHLQTQWRKLFFLHRPLGAGIRRLTGRQIIQSNLYQKERLIRHTGQSSFLGRAECTSTAQSVNPIRYVVILDMKWRFSEVTPFSCKLILAQPLDKKQIREPAI